MQLTTGMTFSGGLSLSAGATVACDPYYANLSLLLPMNGANNSTTFTDYSPSPRAQTPQGDPSISTNQYKWNGSSGYFDGNDALQFAYNASLDWWTTDYTLECWVYMVALTSGYFGSPVLMGNGDTGGTNYWSFGPVNNIIRFYYFNGAALTVSSTATISQTSWTHIAMVKNSSGINLFVNGVGLASPVAVQGTPLSSSGFPFRLGGMANYQHFYMNDLRITKGVARYTSNFTPPTAAFPTVAC
jgi:hypothetical protein